LPIGHLSYRNSSCPPTPSPWQPSASGHCPTAHCLITAWPLLDCPLAMYCSLAIKWLRMAGHAEKVCSPHPHPCDNLWQLATGQLSIFWSPAGLAVIANRPSVVGVQSSTVLGCAHPHRLRLHLTSADEPARGGPRNGRLVTGKRLGCGREQHYEGSLAPITWWTEESTFLYWPTTCWRPALCASKQ